MSLTQDVQEFAAGYSRYSDKQQSEFSRLANKLLGVNFIVRDSDKDKNDYYDILHDKDMYSAFFSILDIDVIFDSVNNVIALKPNSGANHLRLKKNETIVLLVLRKLYFRKQKEISLASKISVTLGDLQQEIINTGLFDRPMPKTEFEAILKLYRRYNICEVLGSDYDETAVLILYPSLLHVVSGKSLQDIENALANFQKNNEADDETTDED